MQFHVRFAFLNDDVLPPAFVVFLGKIFPEMGPPAFSAFKGSRADCPILNLDAIHTRAPVALAAMIVRSPAPPPPMTSTSLENFSS